MAQNRLVDISIWKKESYLELTSLEKIIFKYFCDNSDNAGIIEISERKIKFEINHDSDFSLNDILNKPFFKKRFEKINDHKIFFKKLVVYQQRLEKIEDLNPKNNFHLSIIKRLQRIKKLPANFKDICISEENIEIDLSEEIRNLFEDLYPKKEGLTLGLEILQDQIFSKEDLENLKISISNYTKISGSKRIEHVKNFATFAKCWRDYLTKKPKKIIEKPKQDKTDWKELSGFDINKLTDLEKKTLKKLIK